MKLLNFFQILSLATLAASHPGTKTKNDNADIPYGAFPSGISPSSAQPFVPFEASSEASSAASAIPRLGHAVVKNHCPFPVYIWSVGSAIRPAVTTVPNARYVETFRHDPKSGSIAIKITTVRDGLWTSAPLTIFAYNLSGDGKVWYDLSDIFGDPFMGYPVTLKPAEPAISWENGQSPAGSSIRVHGAFDDLVLTLC
ncbi:Antigenic thaumatin-like protein [Penicillium sp. IBT 16267x]|nr:Antigenic thaumatin-like protein [Penicillium sp. IBT 16267x]